MNYAIRLNMQGEDEILLLCALDGKKFTTVTEVLSSPTFRNGIYLTSKEGIDFPYLICSQETIVPNSIDLMTNLYNVFVKTDFNTPEDIINKLVSNINGLLSADDLYELQLCAKELNSYLNGKKIKIKMDQRQYKNILNTSKLVNEINNSGKASEVYIEGENQTIKRVEPTQELFIRVPSYEQLVMEGGLLPKLSLIEEPYGEETGLNTMSYKKYVTPQYPLEYVLGDASNNDLPLQDNEKRYYNALKSLMDSAIQKEFPDKTLEECVQAHIGSLTVLDYLINLAFGGIVINWSHTGFVPTNLTRFICEDTPDDDDDFEETVTSSGNEEKTETGILEFSPEVKFLHNFVDASSSIRALMKEMFNGDIYSPIDFLIKLYRFGKQKPTRIQIELGGENCYLDMSTFRIVKTSGNFKAEEIAEDENGNNLEPVTVITMKDFMKDKKFVKENGLELDRIDMPVGLLCKRSYKNTDEYNLLAVSFPDLLLAYQENDPYCKVKGISMNSNGELSFNLQEVLGDDYDEMSVRDLVSLVNNGNVILQYFSYSKFIDSFMESNCYDRKLSILSILNEMYSSKNLQELNMYSYSTKEELQSLCEAYGITPRQIIKACVAKYSILLFSKCASEYEKMFMTKGSVNIEDVICLFNSMIDRLGFTGYFGVENKLASTLTTANKVVETPKQEVRKIDSFGGNNTSTTTGNPLMGKLEEGMIICKLYVENKLYFELEKNYKDIVSIDSIRTTLKQKDGSAVTKDCVVLGYMGVRLKPTKEFIFLDPNGSYPASKSLSNLVDVNSAMTSIVKSMALGTECKYKFDSDKSVNYYVKLIGELNKTAMIAGGFK